MLTSMLYSFILNLYHSKNETSNKDTNMKTYTAIIAAALALAACSQEAAQPAPSTPEAAASAAPASAAVPADTAPAEASTPAVEESKPAAAESPAPAETSAPAETQAEPPAEAAAADGKKVFDGLCFGCHAANSAIPDSPRITNKADWAPRIKKGKDTLFKHALEGFTDKGMMPARGGNSALSDDEVKAAVVYMVNESGGKF